jgi:salicylate hydroxylase
MAEPRHILVVGAGIGGLTASLALAKAGFRVTIAERASVLAEIGAGIQLSPNASRILVDLGLEAALKPKAATPEAVVLYSVRAGGEVARVPVGTAAARRYGAPYWVVHRADLQAALLAAVRAEPAIDLRLGIRLGDVTVRPGAVAAVYEASDGAGSAGQKGTIEADGLVGADGVWSGIRMRVMDGGKARYSGRLAYRATIPIDETPDSVRDIAGVWMAPGAHLVHYPVRGGRELNIVAIAEHAWAEEHWSVPAERDEVIARFGVPAGGSWPDPAAALVEAPAHWTKWALATVDPRFDWAGGAVALMGDAAHAMLPFAAQGGAMAIEDAAVLALKLAEARGIAEGFAAYASARRERVAAVARFADRNGRIYHLADGLALLRDTALRLAPADRLAERQAWIWGWRP